MAQIEDLTDVDSLESSIQTLDLKNHEDKQSDSITTIDHKIETIDHKIVKVDEELQMEDLKSWFMGMPMIAHSIRAITEEHRTTATADTQLVIIVRGESSTSSTATVESRTFNINSLNEQEMPCSLLRTIQYMQADERIPIIVQCGDRVSLCRVNVNM